MRTTDPHDIPRLPGLPVLGNLVAFRRDRLHLMLGVAQECGDAEQCRLGPLRIVLLNSSDLVRAADLTQLYLRLQVLPDRRARRGVRYPLPMLFLIAILAKLTGQGHVRAINGPRYGQMS